MIAALLRTSRERVKHRAPPFPPPLSPLVPRTHGQREPGAVIHGPRTLGASTAPPGGFTLIATAPPRIDAPLVRRLIAAQFPRWASLEVRPVDLDGWDNRTFRVGEALAARLPSAAGYVPQVRKEVTWLPFLASAVSLPIPEVVALGEPGEGYPFEWTMRRWIPGTPAAAVGGLDLRALARDLAAFLVELRSVDPSAGPAPGAHSAGRGAGLDQWDAETRAAIRALGGDIDGGAALEEWERALDSPVAEPVVWFHGDVAAGNLLVADGRLSAVIDFGCAGVGDPACDLAIAWTFLDESSRDVLRHGLGADDSLWARGRGWALWKALITADDPLRAGDAARVLSALGIANRRSGS